MATMEVWGPSSLRFEKGCFRKLLNPAWHNLVSGQYRSTGGFCAAKRQPEAAAISGNRSGSQKRQKEEKRVNGRIGEWEE
jgi:hypothetical protein